MPTQLRKPLPGHINRLAAKIALPTAVVITLTSAGMIFLTTGRWSGVAPVVVFLVSLVAAYGISFLVVGRRLRLAYRTLLQIRRRDFENLDAARVPAGDELSGLIRQVYRTGRALQEEIDELRKLENYRREYLGNVSHELKTPIFAIQGFAETLLDGAIDDDEVNRQFLERIIRHSQRLTNLTNDLTEITRIESGELKMTMKPWELGLLAGEVIESLDVEAGQNEIQLRKRIPDDLPRVIADRERIRQVLSNLITNGIKYNNAGGFVEIRAIRLPSGLVKTSVIDSGIGIERDQVPRLTERFYRVDKSRSRTKGGTGLGLAIVKHILEAHSQRLTIESLPGEGSTFSFFLPLELMDKQAHTAVK